MLEEPDRGYAWVVLCAACLVNAVFDGMAFIIGLLYVAIIDEYGATRMEASTPFTVSNAVRYLAGPLTGVLGQTYGIRKVTFFGVMVAAAGSILCAFAPTVEWIVFYWGVVHGLGNALANTLFQVVINQYFERHRATASGLVLSGGCVSALLYPFVIEALLDNYGLSGCFLLLGGLLLNALPPSLVLKSPPWIEFPEAYAKQRDRQLNLHCDGKLDECKTQCGPAESHRFVTEKPNGQKVRFGSKKADPPKVVCTIYQSFEVHEIPRKTFQFGADNAAYVPETNENCREEKPVEVSAPPRRKGTGSLWENVREIPRLYLNPMYILISLTMATYFSAMFPVYGVIVDYSRDKGIPASSEKFLIYSLTIGDLLGCLCFGWVTDRGYMSLPFFTALTYFGKGAFLAVLVVARTAVTTGAALALFGVTSGITFVYFPILVHRYVDPDSQNIGMGCKGLVSGVATFGLPSLIGYFRDDIGSYDGLFYLIASICAATGVLWMLVPAYENRRRKTAEDEENTVGHLAENDIR